MIVLKISISKGDQYMKDYKSLISDFEKGKIFVNIFSVVEDLPKEIICRMLKVAVGKLDLYKNVAKIPESSLQDLFLKRTFEEFSSDRNQIILELIKESDVFPFNFCE